MNPDLIPKVDLGKVKTERFSDYAIRFGFGAGIALVAALIGMRWGPRAGGLFLGFPAVLPAALTLIAKKEGNEEAAIDSIGAILGATAMVAFAIVVSVTVAGWGVVPSLLIALAVWTVVAVGLYFLVAAVYGREPAPP